MNVSLGEFVLPSGEIIDMFANFDESFERMANPKPRAIRPCGHVQSASLLGQPCQACPPVPPKEVWEQPKASEPKINDLRIITKPGTHFGTWFWIEKYYAKQKWDNKKGDWVDNIGWFPVDKDLFGGHDSGQIYRWSRDEDRATKRATKMINKHQARVAKHEANQNRIKSGTKTYTLNTDR